MYASSFHDRNVKSVDEWLHLRVRNHDKELVIGYYCCGHRSGSTHWVGEAMKRSAFLASIAAMLGVARAQIQIDDRNCVAQDPNTRALLRVPCTAGADSSIPAIERIKNGQCPNWLCSTMADPFPHNIVRGQLKPYTLLVDCKHCRNAYFVDSIDPKDIR
jgi:hypothetical protein